MVHTNSEFASIASHIAHPSYVGWNLGTNSRSHPTLLGSSKMIDDRRDAGQEPIERVGDKLWDSFAQKNGKQISDIDFVTYFLRSWYI